MESLATHLVAFLIGTATGAAGSYFATKYTDRRREKEAEKGLKSTFKEIKEIMPELILEMKKDFNSPKSVTVREFAILPTEGVIFKSEQPRFVYYEDQHNNLRGKVLILENHDFVYDVTPGNTPIYRITEDFWNLIRALK